MADRKVVAEGSQMHIRTNRIGPLSIHASAPVVGGTVSATVLEFTVRIDAVTTGNPLLDPELHTLIHEVTCGTLTFSGEKDGEVYAGQASAGEFTVPLSLSATGASDGPLVVAGSSRFSDVHTRLPGLGHIRHLEVDIDGRIHLV